MQPTDNQQNGPKRFTTRRRDVRFFIDDDEFIGIPALPVMDAIEMTKLQGDLQKDSGIKSKMVSIVEIFETFLVSESYERFNARLSDKQNPIDLKTLIEVIHWIIGEGYGLRPTQKLSPSPSGQSTSGQNSTDGALPEVSIPANLVGTDS